MASFVNETVDHIRKHMVGSLYVFHTQTANQKKEADVSSNKKIKHHMTLISVFNKQTLALVFGDTMWAVKE